jgi:hypothetical protein
MRAQEFITETSTTAGSFAPVSMAMGTVSRNGGSLLSGKYTNDPTPNTPKEYKRNKHARGRFKNSPSN